MNYLKLNNNKNYWVSILGLGLFEALRARNVNKIQTLTWNTHGKQCTELQIYQWELTVGFREEIPNLCVHGSLLQKITKWVESEIMSRRKHIGREKTIINDYQWYCKEQQGSCGNLHMVLLGHKMWGRVVSDRTRLNQKEQQYYARASTTMTTSRAKKRDRNLAW